jgi:hypothetical protein
LAGGVERGVGVEDAKPAVFDAVDAAYRDTYSHHASIVDSLNQPEHRANTLWLMPDEAHPLLTGRIAMPNVERFCCSC